MYSLTESHNWKVSFGSVSLQVISNHREPTLDQDVVETTHSYVSLVSNKTQGSITWVKRSVVKETNLSGSQPKFLSDYLPLITAWKSKRNFQFVFEYFLKLLDDYFFPFPKCYNWKRQLLHADMNYAEED